MVRCRVSQGFLEASGLASRSLKAAPLACSVGLRCCVHLWFVSGCVLGPNVVCVGFGRGVAECVEYGRSVWFASGRVFRLISEVSPRAVENTCQIICQRCTASIHHLSQRTHSTCQLFPAQTHTMAHHTHTHLDSRYTHTTGCIPTSTYVYPIARSHICTKI